MKQFALIGAAGYIAPKHFKAIKETNNLLVAAHDKHDSVGILDSYFPNAEFFTEYEAFDKFLDVRNRNQNARPVDYVTVCSPNYLHDSHCGLALRAGAHAICEKPMVIDPHDLDRLSDLEQIYGRRIFAVLQLRHHPEVLKLKRQFENCDRRVDITLKYVTRRGKWYHQSWKGNDELSGGIVMNIGVHFFDFLAWIFGRPESSKIHLSEKSRYSGTLELERARVRWFLSVDQSDLPQEVVDANGYAYRRLVCDGQEIDLSAGFTDLHTEVYRQILAGNGFGVEDTRMSIELIHHIRTGESIHSFQAA